MKKNILNKIKGAVLSKDEARTVQGGYSGSQYACFFVCCPAGTSYTNGVWAKQLGCNDNRTVYYAPQFASGYCVKC